MEYSHVLPREPVEEDHDFSSSYIERLQKRLVKQSQTLRALVTSNHASVSQPLKRNYDYSGNYLDRIRSLNRKRRKKAAMIVLKKLGQKQPVIGLDIDDTLTDTSPKFTEELNKKGHSLDESDKVESRWYKIPGSGVEKGEEDDVFKKFLDEGLFDTLQPDPSAKKVIEELKDRGARIVMITARPESQLKETTIKWLAKHQLPYDAIYFSKDKKSIAEKEQVDFLIDDDLTNAFDPSKVIAFARPWNENYKGKRITKLEDILDLIDKG